MKVVVWTAGLIAVSVGITSAGMKLSQSIPETPAPALAEQREAKTVEGLGYVEPRGEVRRLSFKVGGVISEQIVDLGDRFHRGQPLMRLDSQVAQAELSLATKRLEVASTEQSRVLRGVNDFEIVAAEKDVDIWRQQVEFAKHELDRATEASNSKAISRTELEHKRMLSDNASSKLLRSEAQLELLKRHVLDEDKQVAAAKVSAAKADMELAQARLDQTTVTAPIDGEVLEVLKRVGESVPSDGREPVVIVGEVGRLRVRAELDERYMHLVLPGQKAVVYGRNLGGKTYHGTVAVVKHLMGEKTVFARSAQERKDLDIGQVLIDMDEDFDYPVGMRVDARVITSSE